MRLRPDQVSGTLHVSVRRIDGRSLVSPVSPVFPLPGRYVAILTWEQRRSQPADEKCSGAGDGRGRTRASRPVPLAAGTPMLSSVARRVCWPWLSPDGWLAGLGRGGDLDEASALDVVHEPVDGMVRSTSGWLRMRVTSSTAVCSRSAMVSRSTSRPSGEPGRCRCRGTRRGRALRFRGSAREGLPSRRW